MSTFHQTLRVPRLEFRAGEPDELSLFYRHALGISSESESARLEFTKASGSAAPSAAGLFHVAFLYPDRRALATALLRLVALGVEIHGASDHDVSEAIYLEDPEGNGIEIYADRPEGSWTKESESIKMGTHRLDMDDLIAQVDPELTDLAREHQISRPQSLASSAAALPEELSPPAGVTIGHVHLRSPDLAASEAFWANELGLTVTTRYAGVASFLSAGGYHHHIGINRFSPWSEPVSSAPGLSRMAIVRTDGGPVGSFDSPEGIAVTCSRMGAGAVS